MEHLKLDPLHSISMLSSIEHKESGVLQDRLRSFFQDGLPLKDALASTKEFNDLEPLWLLKSNASLDLDQLIAEKLVKTLIAVPAKKEAIQNQIEAFLNTGAFDKAVELICGNIAKINDKSSEQDSFIERLTPAFCSIPFIKKVQSIDGGNQILQETLKMLSSWSPSSKGHLHMYPLLLGSYILIVYDHKDGAKNVNRALEALDKIQMTVVYKRLFPVFQIILPLLPLVQRFELLQSFVEIIIKNERNSIFVHRLELAVSVFESLSSNKVRTILLLDRFLMGQEVFLRKEILAKL